MFKNHRCRHNYVGNKFGILRKITSTNMNMKAILLLLSLSCLIRLGTCIDCHQCASKDDKSCNDDYDGDEMGDNIDGCDDKDTHCLKIKLIATLADSGAITGTDRRSVTTTRGCIREDGASDYCQAISSSQGVMFKCICAGDNCNGASTMGTSLVLLLTSIAFMLGSRWL